MALSTVTVFIAEEANFGVDPDSDGSSYLPLQVNNKAMASNDQQIVPSNYAVGRMRDQEHLIGQAGGSIPLEIPAPPLATTAGDGAAPAAEDGVDLLITAGLGEPAEVSGEGLAVGGNTTTVVLDSDLVAEEDLLCVNMSDTRSEWRPVVTRNSSANYTVSPPLSGSPPATRDVHGYRYWRDTDTQGPSVSIFNEIGGSGRRLSGGRPSLKLSVRAGTEAVMLSAQLKADSHTVESKGLLPAIAGFSNTPLKPVLSPVHWATTELPSKSIDIDFGTSPKDIEATSGLNGRADIANLSKFPTVTIETAFSADLEADFQAGTKRRLLVQAGQGGTRGSFCFYAKAAQIIAIGPTDDGNYLRQKVTFRVVDPGIQSGTTPYRYWMLARS